MTETQTPTESELAEVAESELPYYMACRRAGSTHAETMEGLAASRSASSSPVNRRRGATWRSYHPNGSRR